MNHAKTPRESGGGGHTTLRLAVVCLLAFAAGNWFSSLSSAVFHSDAAQQSKAQSTIIRLQLERGADGGGGEVRSGDAASPAGGLRPTGDEPGASAAEASRRRPGGGGVRVGSAGDASAASSGDVGASGSAADPSAVCPSQPPPVPVPSPSTCPACPTCAAAARPAGHAAAVAEDDAVYKGKGGSKGGAAAAEEGSGSSSSSTASGGSVRTLTRRPPRLPPPDVEELACGPDGKGGRSKPDRSLAPPLPVHPFHYSAVDYVYEVQEPAVLLGECKCPLASSPAGWSFPCEDYDQRILTELAPWHGVTITHEMLDAAYNLNTANLPPTYHFSIKGGRVYMRNREPLSAYHDRLLDFLRTVAGMVPLPDVEFVFHPWDHAKVPRQDTIPVFAFIRDQGRNDVTIPYVYRWDSGRHDYSWSFDPSQAEGKAWDSRQDRVAWRGGCTGPTQGYHAPFWNTYLRYRATLLGKSHPGVLDVGLSEACVDKGRTGDIMDPVNMDSGVIDKKHLLLLDGNTASGRSSAWFSSGAAVLKPDSVFAEWYYHLLVPWYHFIPVREFLEDLPEQAEYIMARPKLAQCIARNAMALSKEHLRREAAACYMWRLLTAWAKQQPQGSRSDGFYAI